MNVSEMRQMVFDQMQYTPDLANYKNSLLNLLILHYQSLCDSDHWLFCQKTYKINVKKPVTGNSASSISITVQAVNPRKLVCTGFTPSPEMQGQTFTDTDDNTEYRIVSVIDTDIYIDENFPSGKQGSAYYDWKITFDRFALPDDCIEPLSFNDEAEDRGRLHFMSRSKADELYLDKDNSGDPSIVIDDDHLIDEAPISPIVATVTTGGGSAPTGFSYSTKYEYCYTIVREGRESPPSTLATITTPASGNYTIDLSAMDNTGYYETAVSVTRLNSGYQKLIYRRDVTNSGRWLLIGGQDAITTTFSDTTLEPKSTFTRYTSTTFRYSNTTEFVRFSEASPVQYVRFWFTPDEDRVIVMRYHYRPKELQADSDVPILPRQYHHVIVWLTLEDMFLRMQNGGQAQLFRLRAEEVIRRLRMRYLSRTEQRLQFGNWAMSHWDDKRRFGTPINPTFLG